MTCVFSLAWGTQTVLDAGLAPRLVGLLQAPDQPAEVSEWGEGGGGC